MLLSHRVVPSVLIYTPVLALTVALAVPQSARADACTDAQAAVKDLLTFNTCINTCLNGKMSSTADAVQCLPKKCTLTLTMSPQSAQAACTLASC
jgi:hypothetical protein